MSNLNIGLAIYITHGSRIPLRSFAKSYKNGNEKEMQLIFYYDDQSQQYEQLDETGKSLNPNRLYITNTLITFIHQQQEKCPSEFNQIRLCSDANLGISSGHPYITKQLHDLVTAIKPNELNLFSDTPACVDDAIIYLKKEPTNEGFLLPSNVTHGFVANRREFSNQMKMYPNGYEIKSDVSTNDSQILTKPSVSSLNEVNHYKYTGKIAIDTNPVVSSQFKPSSISWFKGLFIYCSNPKIVPEEVDSKQTKTPTSLISN